jgi:hypothetical protein
VRAGLVAGLLAVLAAGCGDSGAEQATTATAAVTTRTVPVQTQWAQRADAICVSYQAQIDALPAPQTQGEVVTVLRNTVTLARDELAALEALEPTPPERPLVQEFLEHLRLVVEATDRLADAAAAADDSAQARALAAGEAAARDAQTAADALGLAACGAG